MIRDTGSDYAHTQHLSPQIMAGANGHLVALCLPSPRIQLLSATGQDSLLAQMGRYQGHRKTGEHLHCQAQGAALSTLSSADHGSNGFSGMTRKWCSPSHPRSTKSSPSKSNTLRPKDRVSGQNVFLHNWMIMTTFLTKCFGVLII